MTQSSPTYLLAGVDTGGTFTDLTIFDGSRVRVHKVLSTPEAPERAILSGLAELGVTPDRLILRHGSTVATNAVLEGKGARTVYLTNAGLADVLTIARQNRARLYDLSPLPEPPPVPPELCLEVSARLGADGTEVRPLEAGDIQRVVEQIVALEPEAVAINLLFSYLDDRHEQILARALGRAMPEELFVSLSSQVLAEIGEYERGLATWLNAAIGPRTGRYLKRLQQGLPGARVSVMQSSGLMVSASQAAEHGVQLLLSGPAGGLAGALAMGRQAGIDRLMTLDVGGTSTDVALIDGDIQITRQGRIARYPVAVPMVDMHTIGAGGGSLARVDDQGLLHVGPQSAGADPGPACYGRGGQQPTLTDANLVLGRIPEGAGLGSGLRLDRSLAERSLAPVAERLGLSILDAASGIVRLANEHMAGALRVISVERGYDPREFALCCFGGAGGLHACDLADLLEMRRVLVPVHAGVLSALGMLASPPGRELTQAVLRPLEALDKTSIEQGFEQLAEPVVKELMEEGLERESIRVTRVLDLRYQGQSSSLSITWDEMPAVARNFHERHRHRYGHALDHEIELVSLRVRVLGPTPAIRWPRRTPGAGQAAGDPWERTRMAPDQRIAGPKAVLDETGTTWIASGWEGSVDTLGNLHLRRTIAGD